MTHTPACTEEYIWWGFNKDRDRLKKRGHPLRKLSVDLCALDKAVILRPDLLIVPQYIMIRANSTDKFTQLQTATNGFTGVDLPANVKHQQSNNSWNAKVVHWSKSQTQWTGFCTTLSKKTKNQLLHYYLNTCRKISS